MRKFLYAFSIVFSFSLLWNNVSAQGKTAGAPLNLNWEEMGPNNIGNHSRALHVSADGSVWAGAVGGGLFKSTDGGFTWTQVPGFDDNLAVSCIASEGTNIYVGTGESFFYRPNVNVITGWNVGDEATYKEGVHEYAGLPGQGVFVSNDGGASWNHNNGTWNGSSTPYDDDFMSIQSIAVSGGKVLIGTLAGLYYSTDADLASVSLAGGPTAFQTNAINDIAFGSGNIVFATTEDSVYKSTNSGTSFGPGINALFPTEAPPNNRIGGSRIHVEVSPVNPSVVYVTGANDINFNCTGVWKSTDDGASWTRTVPFESGNFAPFGGDGRYASVLAADPVDENGFFLGGSRLYSYNENDGLTEAASHTYVPGFSTSYVPRPILAIAFDPNNDSTLYISGDNEIVKSSDKSQTYSFKTKGFNAAHLYAVSAAPNYNIIGSDRFRGLVYRNNGNPNPSLLQFTTIYTSATGIGRFSVTNPNHIIVQAGDGGVNRSLNKGEAYESFYGPPIYPIHPSIGTSDIYVDRPDSLTQGAGLWDDGVAPVNPWVLDEYIPSANLQDDTLIQNTPVWLYLCSRKFIWCCTNPFGTLDSLPAWNRISPTVLSTSTFPREYFTAISVSGDNNHFVYVGTNHGRLFRIQNANDPVNMDLATKFDTIIDQDQGINASMPARWITDIEFDPNDPNNLVITYGAYEQSGSSRVYISNNAMDTNNPVTFWSVGDNLPAGMPVYSAAIHPNTTLGGLIVGTEAGVYTTTDDWTTSGSTINWNAETTGPGPVPVYDIYIRPYYQLQVDVDNYRYATDWTIFIATHGRGIFKSNSTVSRPDPVTPLDATVSLFPNPSRDQATISIEIPAESQVVVELFSLDGRMLGTLANTRMSAGKHTVQLPSGTLENGLYLVNTRISSNQGEFSKTMKAVIAK